MSNENMSQLTEPQQGTEQVLACTEDSETTSLDIEVGDKSLLNDWNIEGLEFISGDNLQAACENQVSDQQIEDRFVELISLLDNKKGLVVTEHIMKEEDNSNKTLKRSRSENIIETQSKQEELLEARQKSDLTLTPFTKLETCDAGIQTSRSLLDKKRLGESHYRDAFEHRPQQPPERHMLHINVESTPSATVMHRAPLLQRLSLVLRNCFKVVIQGFCMLGENVTYIFFVALCCWTLYIIVAHYYNLLEKHVNAQNQLQRGMGQLRVGAISK